MSDRFDVVTPQTPTTLVDLGADTAIGFTGHTVAVRTPSGVIFDLWFYDNDTVSVDVRVRDRIDDVNGDRSVPIKRVIQIPNSEDTRVVAVVAR